MTAAGIITRAVQSVPVKRVGYSGLMVPVLEDNVLAKRWAEERSTSIPFWPNPRSVRATGHHTFTGRYYGRPNRPHSG